ncbi:MAG: hypothetical protein JWN34_715 [Bryobacterales bacterium]|nr:hypothetical protein [Bryobacterales bacterium]
MSRVIDFKHPHSPHSLFRAVRPAPEPRRAGVSSDLFFRPRRAPGSEELALRPMGEVTMYRTGSQLSGSPAERDEGSCRRNGPSENALSLHAAFSKRDNGDDTDRRDSRYPQGAGTPQPSARDSASQLLVIRPIRENPLQDTRAGIANARHSSRRSTHGSSLGVSIVVRLFARVMLTRKFWRA